MYRKVRNYLEERSKYWYENETKTERNAKRKRLCIWCMVPKEKMGKQSVHIEVKITGFAESGVYSLLFVSLLRGSCGGNMGVGIGLLHAPLNSSA